MIPVRLKLSNFTSYGENPPVLDFTKFKLAAISGLNGSGKSSLLDAITWCLWGSSRAGESSDDLVRLSTSEMQAEFIFDLDGHEYTVKRRRSKKHGGQTALEFWSGSTGSPQVHNLTEGTIKATQQKIIDNLHLTYETFTNSAFLRQGHADEFTTHGPTDRKRILADILGLDHYDKLEEKAKEKAKEAQTKLTLLDYQVLEIEAELSQKEERQKNLSQITLQGEQAKKDLKDVEALIKIIEEERQQAHTKTKSLEDQIEKYHSLKLELQDLKTQLDLKEQAKKEYEAILKRKEEILKSHSQIATLEKEREELEKKRSKLIKAKDELVLVQDKLTEREKKRTEAINQEELKVKVLQTENATALSQIEKLKSQKDLCPTCNQPIGLQKNKQIIKENQKLISENEDKLKELSQRIEKFKSIELPEKKQTEELDKEVKKLEEETKEYEQLTQKIAELDPYKDLYLKLQQAEVAVKTHAEAIADLQKIYSKKEQELKKAEDFEKLLEDQRQKLLEIEQKLSAQKAIQQELTEKLMDLRSKYGEANMLVSRVTQMEDLFKQKQDEKNKLTKEKEIFEELGLAFGKKGIQAMIIETAIPEIEDETNRLLDRLTEGRMKVAFITQKETKTKVQTAEGKQHATVETLDIIISDEMGERPYEMYSGGETFRVNFAIRLAISKLLAHRAGAKLQFLVIDEGFGTQDAPGRARLVEVLDIIKNDFEKILIITHIEELKDEFPVRIEVTKGPEGSTFEVVGA